MYVLLHEQLSHFIFTSPLHNLMVTYVTVFINYLFTLTFFQSAFFLIPLTHTLIHIIAGWGARFQNHRNLFFIEPNKLLDVYYMLDTLLM